MKDNNLKLSIDGSVATLCIDNPDKHNSLSAQDIEQFIALLTRAGNDHNVRVLVITGSGERTFCAGASLDQLGSGDLSGEKFETLTDTISQLRVPTICAMNGSAYGGGAEIGLCCDFRIGVKGMRLFVPPARFGLCYPLNGIQRYVQRLGSNTAKRLLVASEEFHGDQLLSLGYLTHLVEPDELPLFVDEMATRISQLAPIAVQTMKQLCNQSASGTLDEHQAQILIDHCNRSQDLQEGLAARAEKRTPHFMGH